MRYVVSGINTLNHANGLVVVHFMVEKSRRKLAKILLSLQLKRVCVPLCVCVCVCMCVFLWLVLLCFILFQVFLRQ